MRQNKQHNFGLLLLTICLVGLFLLLTKRSSAHDSPADAYFQQHLAAESTPSDNYYRNNILRAGGPEPEGPGGETEGGGGYVGMPLGNTSIAGILLMATTALLYKRKRMNSPS